MAVKLICLAFALFCAVSAAPGTRIVGGTPTTIEEYPYIASLIYHYPRPNIYIQRCVGSIISSWHVLTTSFCFTGAVLENMRVQAGSTKSLEGGELMDISSVTKHADYQQTPRKADIAVVFLKEPLRMGDTIGALYIPPAGTNIPDGLVTKVVSWGFESEEQGAPQLDTLKTISLNKISVEECAAVYEGAEGVEISDAKICATAENKGMCRGDAGAPMTYDQVLLGISSFFKECGNSEYPDVFTRIDSYTDWIISVAVAPSDDGTPLKTAKIY